MTIRGQENSNKNLRLLDMIFCFKKHLLRRHGSNYTFALYSSFKHITKTTTRKKKKNPSITLNYHQWNFAMAWREQSSDFRGYGKGRVVTLPVSGMEPSDRLSFILEIEGPWKFLPKHSNTLWQSSSQWILQVQTLTIFIPEAGTATVWGKATKAICSFSPGWFFSFFILSPNKKAAQWNINKCCLNKKMWSVL